MQENLDIQRAIDAANSASLSARNTWLSYILVMAYMGVTLFSGLDPKSSVTLPILSVSFPASFYGVIAPFFFLIMHLAVMMQHVVLRRKLDAFKESHKQLIKTKYPLQDAERNLSPKQRQDHWKKLMGADPIRHELVSYSFTQYIVGPSQSRIIQCGHYLIGFVTLYVLPLFLLYAHALVMSIADQPHSHTAGFAALFLDILVVFFIGAFTIVPANSWQAVKQPLFSLQNYRILGLCILTSIGFTYSYFFPAAAKAHIKALIVFLS